AARLRKQSLYITQCTADTRPEDLIVTPVLSEAGKIAYHASPLVSAMLTGGVCVLDEGNRMNEKSWASLAPLLDHPPSPATVPPPPPPRRKRRPRHRHPRPRRLPRLRHHERGRVHLRGARLHPVAPATHVVPRLPQPRGRDGHSALPPAVRPRGAAGADRRVP